MYIVTREYFWMVVFTFVYMSLYFLTIKTSIFIRIVFLFGFLCLNFKTIVLICFLKY